MPEVLELEPTQAPLNTHQKPTEELRRLCRADFVAGKGNSPQIAVRYNLIPTTVKGWVIDGKWLELRQRREVAELAKLSIGLLPTEQLPSPTPTEPSQIDILKAHLKQTDELLDSCDNAKDRAMLSRARGDFAEQLWVAIHGAKPGTMRPGRSKPDRRSPSVTETPEQVQQPSQTQPSNTSGGIGGVLAEPVKTNLPLPDLSSFSAEQLRAALSLACAKEATTSGVQPSPEQPATPQSTQGT